MIQANVETVMASEKGAVQLMDMLDKAVDGISKIDGRLGLYEKKLSVSSETDPYRKLRRYSDRIERRGRSENHESKRFADPNRNS